MVAQVAPVPSLPRRDEPSRDDAARARLRAAASQAAPAVLAGDRLLAVPGPIGRLLPAGGLRRGSTVALDGPPGAGSTTVAFLLAAATTSAGEWAAVVDPDGTLGARAAAEQGVALERCAIVRRVPPDRWPTVVGALLDGVALVVAALPPNAHLRPGDARRLTARARERAAVLVALGPWPTEATVRVHAQGRPGLTIDDGLLVPGELDVRVEGKGVRTHARAG